MEGRAEAAGRQPSLPQSGAADAGNSFGWQLFHDRQRNLVYYLHGYTGEVRWPRPETVGFVMHGLKPLPAHTDLDVTPTMSTVNPDIWSPYYPHVVMLPSGLMQVHPGPGSEARGSTEMWCGYNRFPLAHFGTFVDGGSSEVYTHIGVTDGSVVTTPTGPRKLPPTWEASPSGSPFLPPYPVAVLGEEDSEEKQQSPVSMNPLRPLDERFQTPEIETDRDYRQYQGGHLRRGQGAFDWSAVARVNTVAAPTAPLLSTPEQSIRRQPGQPKGFLGPPVEKKEHNRKGYLLRQARKLMRETAGSSASSATAAPVQRKVQAMPPPKSRPDFPSRSLEDKPDTFPGRGEYDPLLPMRC